MTGKERSDLLRKKRNDEGWRPKHVRERQEDWGRGVKGG